MLKIKTMCLKLVEIGFTSIKTENGKFWVFCFCASRQKSLLPPRLPHTHTDAASRAFLLYILYIIHKGPMHDNSMYHGYNHPAPE